MPTAGGAPALPPGAFRPPPAVRLAIAIGGLGQLAGTALFILNMWTRVRMPTAAPPPRS